ncbi:MAG: MBOAT family O-acyltransferase [Armatimonadota bacterium]|jgi:alginate O-acetyltransferase complex protein AlgI
MVFSSHVFLYYFLPIALLLYYASPTRWRQMIVALLSYVFYGWANPWFVLLMLFSTTVDYFCGLLIAGRWRLPIFAGDPPAEEGLAPARQRKLALVASIVVNLSLLGFFKYLGFAQANLNYLLEVLGRPALELYTVILPVGISFYTFQSMSYSIDLYRGDARPAKDFLDFACYVALFPQLVAGPIVRYQDLAEQLRWRSHTVDKFARGILFFALGMAKKVLLANPMGAVADAAFGAGDLIWYDAWTGVTAYAFQIYFDFSGYSDMAIGLGLMLGFEFKRNFDLPYLSSDITEFWRRWHISLSTWLRDYLYIPLGGNRVSPRRTYVNLAIVMLLGGLWHGAQWTFVIWGAIHGSLLAFERWRGKRAIYARLPRPLPALCTFVVVLITWVFFRAETLAGALSYTGSMLGIVEPSAASPLVGPLLYQPQYLMVMAACVLIHLLRLDTWELAQEARPKRMALASAAMVASAVILFTQSYNPFLYFRF